jgi:hypothetical protein
MKIVAIRDSECGRFRNRLGSLLTDDLPVDKRQEVLKHALQCGACLRELQILNGMRQRMQRAVQSQAVPPKLQRRIRERIRAEVRRD